LKSLILDKRLGVGGKRKMNIQYTSDLHVDHTGRKVFSSQFIVGDILVMAGDVAGQIGTLANFPGSRTEAGVPILFVPGNHEFYGYPFRKYSTMLRKKLIFKEIRRNVDNQGECPWRHRRWKSLEEEVKRKKWAKCPHY